MVTQEPVKAAIWHALNTYCYTDAIFLVERLFAEVRNEEVLLLLATTYYRAGHVKRAYNVLKKHSHVSLQNKFLLARICFQLNKFQEAEMALCGNTTKSAFTIANEYGALAGVALQLLGRVYRRVDQTAKAIACFKESLKSNPFLWNSFQQLCQMGENVDPMDYFKTSSSLKASLLHCYSLHADITPYINYKNISSENLDPAKALPLLTSTVISKPTMQDLQGTVWNSVDSEMPPPQSTAIRNTRGVNRALLRMLGSQQQLDSPLTPNFGLLPTESPVADFGCSPHFITPPISSLTSTLKPPPVKQLGKKGITKLKESNSTHFSDFSINTPSPDIINSENFTGLRRSNRLFDSSTKDHKRTPRVRFADSNKSGVPSARKTKSRISRVVSSQPLTPTTQNIIQSANKKTSGEIVNDVFIKDEKPSVITLSPIQQSADGLMRLLQDIGKAYHALSVYDCKRAVELFENLPLHQMSTCWVMEQLALAYYEMGDMVLAEKSFENVRELDDCYIDEGMAVYSTLLWLSRKASELSCLAQELVDNNKESAIAWCAMGNCFSLQKEHDLAVKFLQRAVQLDPEFTYAYTLLGHEYVFTEDLDKGLACFRSALRYNERHYNAWYGIGMVYYKQENLKLAEIHFQRALKINPKNSVLLGHLAVTQHELGEREKALEMINRAIEFNSKNALCKYHRARFLFDDDRTKEALEELLELKKLAPKDALVYYMVGKVYQKLGETHLAQQNFSWALSLDPHGTHNMIKDAMNQLQRYSAEESKTSVTSENIEDDVMSDDGLL